MTTDRLKVSFGESEIPGPEYDPDNWMQARAATNRAMALLVVYVLAVATLVGLAFWETLPQVLEAQGIQAQTGEQLTDQQQAAGREFQKNLFVLVACAGAAGGLLHLLSSVGHYVGARQLVRSWLLFYYLRPIVGALLGVFVYLILRTGVLTTATTPEDFNLYGILAFSALAGLFSRQALDKLAEVFDTLFQKTKGAIEEATPGQVFGGRRADAAQRLPENAPPTTETFSNVEEARQPE